jgi:hypothetical protein
VRALVELFELEKALHEIHRELEQTTDRAADPIGSSSNY